MVTVERLRLFVGVINTSRICSTEPSEYHNVVRTPAMVYIDNPSKYILLDKHRLHHSKI